jgi:hypothetical protein
VISVDRLEPKVLDPYERCFAFGTISLLVIALHSSKVAKIEQHLRAGTYLKCFIPVDFVRLSVLRSLFLL